MDEPINQRKNKKNLLVGAGIICIAIIGIYSYFKYNELYPSTDNAYISTNIVNVAAKVGGYLSTVNIANNQYIAKGDLLLSIDPKDYQINLTIAKKNYKSQQEMVDMAKQQIKVQKGQIA
ncbi:MAG: biotin/lipoyl-binding protein, partial [Burkholderiales bacterium]|nr:biotin/lipoyl-binding protein [Burkholderiales bacterium]